jgi:hypothetical protein
MSETPDNAHRLAAEKHADKRAANRVKRAAKPSTAKGKSSKSNRVKAMPLDRSPNPELTAEQRMTMTNDQIASMTLTKEQRLEVSQDRQHQQNADTQASMARPVKLTPLQEKRYQKTIAKLAAMQARKDRHKKD